MNANGNINEMDLNAYKWSECMKSALLANDTMDSDHFSSNNNDVLPSLLSQSDLLSEIVFLNAAPTRAGFGDYAQVSDKYQCGESRLFAAKAIICVLVSHPTRDVLQWRLTV